MTRKEFIENILEPRDYLYKIVGDKIHILRDNEEINLEILRNDELPGNIIFNNSGFVDLKNIKTLPPGIEFGNAGQVYLNSLNNISPYTKFNNIGFISLRSLKHLPEGVEFNNEASIQLTSIVTIEPGVIFKDVGTVYLKRFALYGPTEITRVKNLSYIRVFNIMIKQGVFL